MGLYFEDRGSQVLLLFAGPGVAVKLESHQGIQQGPWVLVSTCKTQSWTNRSNKKFCRQCRHSTIQLYTQLLVAFQFGLLYDQRNLECLPLSRFLVFLSSRRRITVAIVIGSSSRDSSSSSSGGPVCSCPSQFSSPYAVLGCKGLRKIASANWFRTLSRF